MPTVAERSLRKALREKSFASVYCLAGQDDFLKEGAVRELMDAVVDEGTREFNRETLRGAETNAQALDTTLNTPPLLAERRLVVVRDAHLLRKDAKAVLAEYLRRPAERCVLVLVLPSGEKVDRVLAEASEVVDFPALTSERIPAWIAHHAGTVAGVGIAPAAAALLQAAVGDDLGALSSELDKLASYTGGREVREEDVRAVVGVREGEGLGALLDAVAERDGARAVPLVRSVLAQPRVSAVSIIMVLATQMLAIAWGSAARGRGIGPGALEREFYALLRDSKAFPGRPWGEAVRGWSRASALWSAAASEEALRLLLLADAASKEARVSTDEQLVESLVLSLCAMGRSAAA